MQRKLVLGFCVVILFLSLLTFTVTVEAQEAGGDISFRPNMIPEVDVYYEDYSFVFELKSYFIRIRPFVIYDNQYYGMKQIVTWIKNNYPNVDYKWLVDKAMSAIHYGFNLTRLPQAVADKIDFLGFRLVDWNFPLSWFELENVELFNGTDYYNITRIHIQKANLVFSFEDLYPQGYTVQHINSTYVLVGNVKGKTDLIVDPITFGGGIMTLDDGTFNFWDLWNASSVNGWNVVENPTVGENTSYIFGCRIMVGNSATTWLIDTEVQVIFNSTAPTANGQNLIDVEANYGNIRFGTLEDETDRSTSEGISIITLDTYTATRIVRVQSGATANFYSSQFINAGSATHDISLQASDRVWNCILSGIQSRTIYDAYHTTLTKTTYGLIYPTGAVTFTESLVASNSYGFYQRTGFGQGSTIQDSIFRDNTFFMRGFSITADNYLINVESDAWSFLWGGVCTANTNRQYHFGLTVTFPNGTVIQNANVTVTHYGQGETEDFTELTDASGQISQKTLTMGFYNQTGGDTIYSYNPFNIEITNATGYQDYNKNFTLSEQTEWIIALTPTVPELFDSTYYLLGGISFLPFSLLIAFLVRRKQDADRL